ncbi:MAG: hypothetical protein CVU48_07605 [Candidatus Cloacimonetes bacterium HGW-Cloacimonetes-1]|jgi:hypothetical protein|nr:MAG: hypothetical protein CVU48_07605 [Candidatus Cloacimonetes bacterium HGW-Cloacimonetes-1]
MKVLFMVTLAIMLALAGTGCENKADNLTQVKMETLVVPDGFNYETSRTVTVLAQGLYKSSISITTLDGLELSKGLLDPVNGFSSLITIPRGTAKLIMNYNGESVTVKVIDDVLEYSFIPGSN